MAGAAVGRGLVALGHAVVAADLGDPEAVVGEDLAAAPGLRKAMLGEVPPGLDGGLVAPEGERDELAGLADALEALDRDEAVDPFQERPELGGDLEIGGPVLGPGPELEDHGDHGTLPS